MPELTDLLKTALPADDPSFDAGDIAARVARRGRRRRAVGATTLVVVAIGLVSVALVATGLLGGDRPGAVLQQPDGTAEEAASTPAAPLDRPELPEHLSALVRQAADAGYEVRVQQGTPTSATSSVTFLPEGQSASDASAAGTVTATVTATVTEIPDSTEDLTSRHTVTLMYRLPVWASARNRPLVDCDQTRLAADGGQTYETLVELMDCTPLYVVDPATMPEAPEVRHLVDIVVALLDAGAEVRDVSADADPPTFSFSPGGAADSPAGSPGSAVTVMLRPTTNMADATPTFVPLGDGFALQETGGMLAFACGDVYLATTGPTAGGSDLASVGLLPDALGCAPIPPRATQAMLDDLMAGGGPPPGPQPAQEPGGEVDRTNEREDRLLAAFADLGVENVAGEPSHGGSGASMGFMWEDSLVYVYAMDPIYDDPSVLRGDVIDLAGGRADLGDGDGLPSVSFDCGDTGYSLQHDAPNDGVHIRAAEALVIALGCTPTVGGA